MRGPQRRPVRTYRAGKLAQKACVFAVDTTPTGTVTLDIPPGCVVPRFYPDNGDDLFVWSGSTPLAFQGVSPDLAPGQTFKSTDPISLRWCVTTDVHAGDIRFPAKRLFFEVFSLGTWMKGGVPIPGMSKRFVGQRWTRSISKSERICTTTRPHHVSRQRFHQGGSATRCFQEWAQRGLAAGQLHPDQGRHDDGPTAAVPVLSVRPTGRQHLGERGRRGTRRRSRRHTRTPSTRTVTATRRSRGSSGCSRSTFGSISPRTCRRAAGSAPRRLMSSAGGIWGASSTPPPR